MEDLQKSPGSAGIPTCMGCSHFYVTYQPAFPYGCRAFSMLTRSYPYLAVAKESGMSCLYREERPERENVQKLKTPSKKNKANGWSV
jgi:hypothetical protein